MRLIQAANELYFQHFSFFFSNLILALFVHVFFTVIVLLLKEVEEKEISIDEASLSSSRFSLKSISVYLTKEIWYSVAYLYRFYPFKIESKKDESSQKINALYLTLLLAGGALLSIGMLILAEFIYPASLVVFVVTLTLSLLYFAGMGQVRHFNESLSNAFGLSYHQSIFRLKTNPQKELDEKAAILGLSLFAGMIGITTTVGGAALEPPLSFVLIPATFDMLSLIVAFIEFPGTKVIMPLLYELRKIRQSLFTLLITLLWSMYLTTILWLFHEAAPFQLSRPLVNTVITVSWLLIALVVSSLINQLDLSRRNVFLITIASLLPLAITLML